MDIGYMGYMGYIWYILTCEAGRPPCTWGYMGYMGYICYILTCEADRPPCTSPEPLRWWRRQNPAGQPGIQVRLSDSVVEGPSDSKTM